MTHDTDRDTRLTRLLQSAGPESIPTLEPDPYLAARIRAMKRDIVAGRRARRRWLPVSLGTAALAVALLVGSYIGYTTGTAMANAHASEATMETAQAETAATLWDAFSQAGFADELESLDSTNNGDQP